MSKQELAAVHALLKEVDFTGALTTQDMRVNMDAMAESFKPPETVSVAPANYAGVPGEWVTAQGGEQGPVFLYLHGGGYVLGSPTSHRHMTGYLANAIGGRALVIDYRLAPENPFPAAVEDATAVYDALLKEGVSPGQIFIGGDSAGGGLTVATLLSAKNQGLPMPAGAYLLSPWTDLTMSGESHVTKADVDPMVAGDGINGMVKDYVGGGDPADPLASPLFGDLKGLPPILIQTGSDEVLLSDSEMLNDRLKEAGVPCKFEVWDTMFHVWHMYWPILSEGRDALDGAAAFVKSNTGGITAAAQ
jgi:phosphinothricin tripeptide acetyl hydrolase